MSQSESVERAAECPWCHGPAANRPGTEFVACWECACGAVAAGLPSIDFDEVLDEVDGLLEQVGWKGASPPQAASGSSFVSVQPILDDSAAAAEVELLRQRGVDCQTTTLEFEVADADPYGRAHYRLLWIRRPDLRPALP